MRFHSRQNMPWLWLDPLYKLKHNIIKSIYGMPHGVNSVLYTTYCGIDATVDDINPRTKAEYGFPTCFGCIVAEPLDDVRLTKE